MQGGNYTCAIHADEHSEVDGYSPVASEGVYELYTFTSECANGTHLLAERLSQSVVINP